MYKSMTGFGKAACDLKHKVLTIEVKSLNSKNLDLNIRIPSVYKEYELALRNIVSRKLVRGKVDVLIYTEAKPGYSQSSINRDVVKKYYQEIRELREDIPFAEDRVLETIMRLPDSMETNREELDKEEWKEVEAAFEKALDELDSFRISEGEKLYDDILGRIDLIDAKVADIIPLEQERIGRIRERIMQQSKEILQSTEIDNNRLEQELVFYLEKLDITEEKVRLKAHCDFFKEVSDGPASQGKKLGFISQEIGREINTLGSKANHQGIQKVVVDMKDELEKIKEQLLNIL